MPSVVPTMHVDCNSNFLVFCFTVNVNTLFASSLYGIL